MDAQEALSQQLVDTLQREVAEKEAELAILLCHRALLIEAFSTPTFPPGYIPSPPSVHAENSNRLYDHSNVRPGLVPNEPGPSGRVDTLKTAESPTVGMRQMGRSTTSSCPPENNPPIYLSSELETSGDSDCTPTTIKDQQRNQLSQVDLVVSDDASRHARFQSSGAGKALEPIKGKVLRSPAGEKTRNPKFPVVNWTDQIRRRAALNSNGDSSTDNGDSISSDASIDKDQSYYAEGGPNIEKTEKTADQPKKPLTQAQTLPSDARPEDVFDWEVLGISGPWSPDQSSSILADSSWSNLQKQQSSLPSKFQTMDEYKSNFEGLIFEECKARLKSSWDILKTPAVGTSQNGTRIEGVPEDVCQSSLWQFRSMYPSANDPFKYAEAELVEGANIHLDQNEVVLLSHNNTKLLAIMTPKNFKSVLFRTRVELPPAGGQCALLQLTNMVSLKRQYTSLCRFQKIWDPLQQQLLDPLDSNDSAIPLPCDDCTEEDVKANSCTKTVKAWKKQSLFNKQQLGAIEAMLHLQQGFFLVQGPPGTGKTSTIVGMISAVHIQEPRSRILVCASSNAAIDEIVSRLMRGMLDISGKSWTPDRGTLIRVGVEKSIQTACLPVLVDKVVQGNSVGLTSNPLRRDAVARASIVCSTIVGSGHQIFDDINQKFDLLVIDEAAQVLESEVLIALQRVKGRCVMVGDPCQLHAVVLQKPGKAYGRSLFERMQEAGRPVSLMTIQYRMHPHISQFPSATFYGGRLKDSFRTQSMLPFFKEETQEKGFDTRGYRFKLGAYCFLDVTWGVEQGETVGYSLSNIGEAELVAAVVQRVVKSLKEGIEPNIGVITPYLAQKSAIMWMLEEYGVDEHACEVNTVDGFQGREKDVIILSCVRAQAENGLGFVSNKRRMNVALTRAKRSLIIVGHSETLRRQSSIWNALIEDASARELYQILRPDPRRIELKAILEGGTPLKTASSHQSNHTRYEQRTPILSRPLQRHVSLTGQDVNQNRPEQIASAAADAAQNPSHIRFEGDADVDAEVLEPSNHISSKKPLSVICGMAEGPYKPNSDNSRKRGRPYGDGGQAEESRIQQGRQIKVKIEAEDHSRSPAVPPAPVRRMRGQISNKLTGSGWHESLSLGTSTAKVDNEDANYSDHDGQAGFQGSGPVQSGSYYNRDDSDVMETAEDSKSAFARSYRGRGSGHHCGSVRSDYERSVGRGQNRGRGNGHHGGYVRSDYERSMGRGKDLVRR